MTVAAEKAPRRPIAQPRTVESTVSRLAGGGANPAPTENPDDKQIVTYSVRLTKGLRRRVKVAALGEDKAVQDVTVEALELWLEARERRLRGDNPDAE